MTTQNRIKTVLTHTAVAMAILGLITTAASADVIFVVDAPNDANILRRTVVPGDGTRWPETVSQTFDLSTDGYSAAGLSGTLYVSGTGWFEGQRLSADYPPPPGETKPNRNDQVFHGDYAGDMTGAHTAIWTVTGYPPGMDVDVYVFYTYQANYATQAPYSVNGGAPVVVNMTTAPLADLVLNDGPTRENYAKDRNFERLGTFQADSGGQVQVVLAGQNNWAPVDAMAFVSGPLDPNLPSVDAGSDMISWSGALVALDPNVVNNDTNEPQGALTYLWTAEPDGIGDPNLDVAITDANQEDASVTITKTATGDATVVTMTLSVTLEGKDPVKDTMTIDVYDDSCQAAKAAGPVEFDITDIDENCITNFADFAVMAATWLDDYTLTEAVAK
jgi:hypothetical protein